MNLQKTSGVVENLRIVRIKQNILYGPQMEKAAGVSAVVFALAGMAGAAVQTSMNSDGGADDVDMYSFEIAETRYAGCTRGLSLKNGDEVEVAYEVRSQGNEALAVRRPATRSIWLYPYMSRGSRAATVSGLVLWGKASLGMGLLMTLIANAANFVIGKSWITMEELLTIFVSMFFLLAIGTSWMLPRLFRFSRAADEVFAAFGFDNPKWVDLQKTTKAYLKANKIPWSIKNMFELWY